MREDKADIATVFKKKKLTTSYLPNISIYNNANNIDFETQLKTLQNTGGV